MLLEACELRKSFSRHGLWQRSLSVTHAVDAVSFSLDRGETLAIVGESGSGKSTTARLVMHLLEPDAGRVMLHGEDFTAMNGKALRQMRRHIQMVFQDPFASLNPRMRIVESVGEGLRVHAPDLNREMRKKRVCEMLERCGLSSEALERYPHQFSGGQRQRIGIARALIVEPSVLVLDEPVSALDVSVQAQILNLLRTLQQEQGFGCLFISHDLSVVRQVADRVAVMFAGRIVEQGETETVFSKALHPYTASLLAARPMSHPDERLNLQVSHFNSEGIAESGCRFRLRCPNENEACVSFEHFLQPANGSLHHVACIHPLKHNP
ncbi:MAG: ATP-binding cassette domain-containing protein [Mariprofundaceae bacterium]